MATAQERHNEVMGELSAIKLYIAERKHLDDKILEHDAWIYGNGTPGAKSQLRVVLLWNKAVMVALVIDILSNFLS